MRPPPPPPPPPPPAAPAAPAAPTNPTAAARAGPSSNATGRVGRTAAAHAPPTTSATDAARAGPSATAVPPASAGPLQCPAKRTDEQLRYGLNAPNEAVPQPQPGHKRWSGVVGVPGLLACPIYELPSFLPTLGINYDAMHTIGGDIKDAIVKYLQGLRTRGPIIIAVDRNRGAHVFGTSSPQLDQFRKALVLIANAMPKAIAGRLLRLTMPGKKAKTATFFLLAGPFGAFAIVYAGLRPEIKEAMLSIINVCSELWCKVQYSDRLEALRQRVAEAICRVELVMSCNESDIKLHNLLHLVDAIYNLGRVCKDGLRGSLIVWVRSTGALQG